MGADSAAPVQSARQAQELVWRATVVDAAGQPLPGARLQPAVLGSSVFDLASGRFGATLEAANTPRFVVSDSEGVLDLDALQLEAGDQAWLCHPSKLARLVRLGEPGQVSRYVLDEDSSMLVETARTSGQFVSGVEVVAMGYRLDEDSGEAVATSFRELVVTGEDGRALLSPFPGALLLRGRKGALLTDVVESPGAGRIGLYVFPSFELRGTTAPSLAPERLESLRVEVLALEEEVVLVDELPVDSHTGLIGPARIPLHLADEYSLRLLGEDILAVEQRIQSPRAETSVSVHFELVEAAPVEVVVVDTHREAIQGIQVRALWRLESGSWESGAVERSDADGAASLRGVRPGHVLIQGWGEGYADASLPDQLVPHEGAFELMMHPAGVVHGRVTHRGEPVASYQLMVLPHGQHEGMQWIAVDDPDGAFEVPNARAGPITVVAWSDELPRSEPAGGVLEQGGTLELELELPAPLPGFGRVVDASTGLAIEGAQVRVWSNNGSYLLAPSGAPVTSRPDGSFELEGLPPGDARVMVEAPGYVSGSSSVTAKLGEPADLGTVTLARPRLLDVVLATPAGVDPSDWRFEVDTGMQRFGPATFDVDGHLPVDTLRAGLFGAELQHPDGSVDRVRFELSDAAPEWRLELDARGEVELRVHMDFGDGGAHPASSLLEARYTVAGLTDMRRSVGFHEDGTTHMRLPALSDVLIGVRNEGGLLALESIDLRGLQERDLYLECEEQSREVAVLDGTGAPVVGAHLWFSCADGYETWVSSSTTDAMGIARIGLAPCDQMHVYLSHPTAGWDERDLLLFDGGEPVPVRLQAENALSLRLLDGDRPLEGVRASLRGALTGMPMTDRTSNVDGALEWGQLGEGEYLVRIEGAGYQPLEARLESRATRAVHELQVRRLGELLVTIRDEGGAPLAGQVLELSSIEYERAVGALFESGLAPGAAPDLVSDAQGRVVIARLPRGEYAWRVAERSGVVSVLPLARATLEIQL